MEEKKSKAELSDEQLAQVTGGAGDTGEPNATVIGLTRDQKIIDQAYHAIDNSPIGNQSEMYQGPMEGIQL